VARGELDEKMGALIASRLLDDDEAEDEEAEDDMVMTNN